MNRFSGTPRFTALCIAGALAASCAPEPPEKPVQPLDPTKALAEEAPVETTSQPSTPGRLTRMPLGDLYQLVQSEAAVIYDVRPSFSYKMGHVPGAISWPKKDFDADLAKHEPRIRAANTGNTPVVIYCTDMACPDATSVGTRLVSLGHSVSILQGGYEAWKIAAK